MQEIDLQRREAARRGHGRVERADLVAAFAGDLIRLAEAERHRRSLLREEAGLSRSSRLIARGLLSIQPSPFERLQRLEMARRIGEAVNDLNDQDREIVIMRNVEDLTFEEIAQVLEVRAAAVRQRYGRALLKLRQKLKGGSSSRT